MIKDNKNKKEIFEIIKEVLLVASMMFLFGLALVWMMGIAQYLTEQYNLFPNNDKVLTTD